MNRDFVVGIILAYLGLGIAYSEYRRILVAIALDKSMKHLLDLLMTKKYIVLNFIFKPIVVGRLKFDEWRYKFKDEEY